MAKINVNFNNKVYNIDESSFSTVSDNLKSHLSTKMNGTGAVIDFGGQSYNIDSTKLSTARNDFVTHLGKISGDGYKVNVNGVDYDVDATKVASAISELCGIFDALESGGNDDGGKNYSEGLEFTSNGDGTCYISGIGNCTDSDIVIPHMSPDGDTVTSIGYKAFYGCESITSVVIPEGVITIESSAFHDCINLISVTIPSSVTRIKPSMLYNCLNVTHIFMGNPVGWYVSRASNATSGQVISAEDLANAETAVTLLIHTYCAIHWFRSEV